MNRPLRHLLVLLLTLAVATGVASPASGRTSHPADRAAVAARKAPAREATTEVQRVRVNWKGTWKKQVYVNSANVPGVGDVDLICKPNDTRIRLYTDDRKYETQMWLQKYETKNGRRVVSVKTPRIYQWAHADDDGKGGTGFVTHEGLNQVPSIENRSQDGYMYGVISQRSGRADVAGTQLATPKPVTTFELTWNWNGFNHPQKYRSCTIDATFTTQFPADQRTSLTWRGWQETKVERVQTVLPGVGWLILDCGATSTNPTVSIDPYDPTLPEDVQDLYLEEVVGEGDVAAQRTTRTLAGDQMGGVIGPYPLPTNGTVRMRARNGSTERWIMLSTYSVTDDEWGPRRNVCELAAGWYNR